MLLSDLIGTPAHVDGHRVGTVVDVRLRPAPADSDSSAPQYAVHGLLISPHATSSTLGYERSQVRSPWPIAAFTRWRHRDSFLVHWDDVTAVDGDTVTLRTDHRRYVPDLVRSASPPPSSNDFDNR